MSSVWRLGRRLKSPRAGICRMLLSARTRWVVVVGIPLGMSASPRWEQSTLVPSHLHSAGHSGSSLHPWVGGPASPATWIDTVDIILYIS